MAGRNVNAVMITSVDDWLVAVLLVGVFVAVGLVAWRDRATRRPTATPGPDAWRVETVMARMRGHGGPYGGRIDDDAPVWESADDFALAVAITELGKLGFFADSAHLSIQERVVAIKAAYEARHGRPYTMSDDFRDPRLAALDPTRVWWRDAEADVAQGNHVYSDVLAEWAKISRGLFVPEDVRETWSSPEGPIEVVFRHQGESYTLHPTFDHDWLDFDALGRVNACLTDHEFMTVHTGDQTAFVVCCTVDEGVKLQDRGWPILGRRRTPSS